MTSHRFFSQCAHWLSILVATLALTACGGGGGESPNAPSVPNPPVTVSLTPVVTTISPTSAAAGVKITVTGQNLSKVATVRIGTLSFTPTLVSETKLEFTVPTGARSSRIELISPDGTSLSAVTLVVTGVPTIGSVAPTTIIAGQNVTISGTNLDKIGSITLNGTTLAIASGRTATALTVTIPVNAVDGLLTLVATDGVSETVQILVNAALKLNSFSPASGLEGASVTLNGIAMSRVTSINFTGTTTAASITARSTSTITVNVPVGATTGPITLRAGAENASSSTSFTVIPRIRVNSAAVYNVAAAGLSVAINGTGLDQVSNVTVANANASITSRSATQLVFNAPSGVLCGAITLSSLTQPGVAAGSLVVGAGCVSGDVTISGIEFAQVHALSAGATYQRLSPGKETWVRTYITSRTTNKAAPTVRLTASTGSTIVGSLTMAGPTILPVLAAGSTPTDAMRYSITQTFRVQLPDAWVTSGLKVRIDVDPSNAAGPLATQEATPVMGEPIVVDLVLVPLITGTTAPNIPPTSAITDALVKAFPVPRGNLTVTTRATPITLTTPFYSADGVFNNDAWLAALQQLAAVMSIEAPKKTWYGFVKVPTGGTLGLGNRMGRGAVGKDADYARWENVMIHELGHVFGLKHVGCPGDAANDDLYPYAEGLLGPAPLFNSLTDLIADPKIGDAIRDVMLCTVSVSKWLSDYSLGKMQLEMEARTVRNASSPLMEKAAAGDTNLIMVSGVIDPRGARISQVLPRQGVPELTNPTGYELELRTASGQVILVPVQVNPVDHTNAKLFSATAVNPGQLVSMRILHNGRVIGEKTSSAQMKADTGASAVEAGVPWARIKESGALATFEWNAAYGTASIIHLLNGQRSVLTLAASGGRAEFDISQLPRGGVFEVGLSDGLNVHSLTLTR